MEELKIASLNVSGIRAAAKRRSLFDRLRRGAYDLCLIQESHCTQKEAKIWQSEWGSQAYFCHGSSSSKGVIILLNRDLQFKVERKVDDGEGRILLLEINTKGNTYVIGSLYAPTADSPEEQNRFMDSLEESLTELNLVNVILGGDLNVVLCPSQDRSNSSSSPTYGEVMRQRVYGLMDETDLTDVWRYRNPSSRQYTFHRGSQASRIDYWLISNHLADMTSSSNIIPIALSDHALLTLNVGDQQPRRGPGLWRLDNSLLGDAAYVEEISNLLESLNTDSEGRDPLTNWEWVKFKIRERTVEFETEKRRASIKEEKELNKKFISLMEERDSGKEISMEELDSIKRELSEIEQSRAQKIIFRARANYARYGEKSSKYFLNLEKRKAKGKIISSLITEDGTTLTETKDILEFERAFYEKLYEQDNDAPEIPLEQPSLNFPRISDLSRERLEGELSAQELQSTLKLMSHGKCPGSDGITVEFYVKFWPLLEGLLVRALQVAIDKGEMLVEQRRGIVMLIPKKGLDRRKIANWRPITLLNTDYKLLTKAYAIRLQSCVGEVILGDQTGFMRGRYIGTNVRTISDIINFSRINGSQAWILGCDFCKAFDMVRWDMIVRSLQWFGFGEGFIDVIKMVFTEIETAILNNGYTSRYFKPTRGVRQGCCISPYLFLLAVEPLAIQIREDHLIRGVSVGEAEFKLSMFADDLTGFAQDSRSLERMIAIVQDYQRVSGLTMNMTKSVVMKTGVLTSSSSQVAGLQVVNRFQTLGVWFSQSDDADFDYEWNFLPIIHKMRACFSSWELRSLSLKGKIVVINTLVVSLLQYMGSLIYTPQRVLDEVNSLTVEFIWGKGRSKVAYTTLIQAVADGGLKFADLETRIKVSYISWVKRILSDPSSCPAAFLRHLLGVPSVTEWLRCKPKLPPIESTHSKFYSTLLKVWIEVHSHPPEGEAEIRNETLWDNKFIGVALQDPALQKRWREAGIKTVQDICHNDEDRLLSHSEIKNKFRVHCTIIEALQLRMAIPLHWRTAITRDFKADGDPPYRIRLRSGVSLSVKASSPKRLYSEMIAPKRGVIRAQRQWETTVDVEGDDEWSEVYLRPFKTTRETRLQSFQFRLTHRLITCNRLLLRYKIKQEDTCAFCDGTDTLEHFFYQCPISRRFWQRTFAWMRVASGQDLSGLAMKEILLGVPNTFHQAKRTNSLLLISGYFIHRQRLFHNGDLCITHWENELRKRLLAEKFICAAEGKPAKFDKWVPVPDKWVLSGLDLEPGGLCPPFLPWLFHGPGSYYRGGVGSWGGGRVRSRRACGICSLLLSLSRGLRG